MALPGPNEICPHVDGIEYSDFAEDLDFIALFGQPVRAIEIVTAGSGALVVVTERSGRIMDGENPTTRTYTALTAGTWLGGSRGLNVARIVATGTSVARIRVWL